MTPPFVPGGMPLSAMMLQGLPEEQNSNAPVRVGKALDFLALLTRKQQKSAAATEHNIEIIEPDPLCSEEEAARDAALQMLAKYFDGRLKPDRWENKKENKEPEGLLIGCVACHPLHPDPECILCHGSGKILVTAAGSVPSPSSPITTLKKEKSKKKDGSSCTFDQEEDETYE